MLVDANVRKYYCLGRNKLNLFLKYCNKLLESGCNVKVKILEIGAI